jgi:hypothetical protein
MKFLSDILAKAGLTVDGVVTLNNTATGQTPDANDNSTKLATTAWVRTFVQPYSLPIASASILGGVKVGSGLSIDSGTGVLSVTGGGAASIKSTQTFIATGGQTVFTVTGGYTAGLIDVFLNGVYLSPNQTTATNGTTVVLDEAAAAGDIIDVIVASPVYEGATTTTDQLPEGVVNLYYTNARARAAVSLTTTGVSGVATYNSSTGVFNIPNYQGLVPSGGTIGQILTKNSSTDYDSVWMENYAEWTAVLKHRVKAGVAITKGQAVYVSSSDGTNMIVSKASNASESTSSKTMGLLESTVSTNGFTNVITEGLLGGLNTATATAGDPVWLGTGGNLIYGLLNKPYAPAHLVFIGIVTRVNANNGEIFVKVQNGFELDELHDLSVKNASDGDMIKYVASTGLWTKIAASTTNIVEGTNLYYTQSRFDTAFAAKSTSNLTEGTNLYYTTARANTDFDTRLATKSTTNLAEGTNLYYTDARVGIYLTANSYATQTYVNTAVSNLVDAAPGTLDTLNELAAALGDDPNFATTVATSIGTKEPIITAGTTSQYWRGDKSWQTLPIYTLSGLGGQPQLNGSGFVKISGTTVSYDNSTYYLASNPSGYITGNQNITLSGEITGSGTTSIVTTIANNAVTTAKINNGAVTAAKLATFGASEGISWAANTDGAFIRFISTSNATGASYLEIGTVDDLNEEILFTQSGVTRVKIHTDGNLKNGSNQFYLYENGAVWGISINGNANYATTAGALSSMNISQFTNNSGYITGYTETDTLATVTARGASTTTSITAERFRTNNSLVLNTFTTVNPSSNVFLYSQPNDRDSWIYLDSADTGSNWGIYHRQIDSAVSGLEGNSIGFIGGGASALKAYIGLSTGNGYFAGTISAANFSGTHSGSSSGTNTGDQTNISGNAGTATYLKSPFPYNINITDGTTAQSLSDGSLTSVNMHASHGLFGGFATTLTMSGYDRYGVYQISGNYNATVPEIAMRNYNQAIGGYTSWIRLLSSANYNSYAPTLTGTGASGTWGISITGSAGSLSSMNISQFTNNSGYITSSATSLSLTGNLIVSSGNATGGGIILADDGDIVDLNDSYLSLRFSSGVRIFSANRGGSVAITLGGNGVVTATTFSGALSGNATTASSISGFNNPTTAVTANTIVYRDGSGDVAAREFVLTAATIHTDTPSSMIGIYPTTNQVVKFGSGASRNFLNVPTRTGGDASGTWAINSTGYAIQSHRHHSGRDFPAGTLIETTINYSVTYGDPFILEITGNSYGSTIPFDIQYQGYIYADTIINHGGVSNGTNISGLVAINYNGKLCFWFPSQAYWQGFNVYVYTAYGTYAANVVTNISNTGKPTTAKEVDLSGNIRQSLHSGNFTSYAASSSHTHTSFGNLSISPSSAAWAEGISFTMPTTSTWGGLRWRRERGNADGNWYVGYVGFDSSDDLIFGSNNGGAQIDNILRLTKGGSVAIGLSSPEGALHIAKVGQDDQLVLGSAATNRDIAMHMYSGTVKAEVLRFQSGFRLLVGNGSSITTQSFITGGVERLTINNSGVTASRYFGSGFSIAAGSALILAGSGASFDNSTGARLTESYGPVWNLSNGSTWHHQIINGSSLVGISAAGTNFGNGNILASGDITAYYSDMRLKNKISNIENALDKVLTLSGFYYTNNEVAKEHGYIDNKIQVGVSAQEVEAVLPEIVTLAPFDITGNDAGDFLSKSGFNFKTVKYDKLAPLFIEAIKELKAENDTQKIEIEELKDLVKQLINR